MDDFFRACVSHKWNATLPPLVVSPVMNSKASRERQQRILQELVRQPGNNVCADCKSRAPQWASTNHGVFVCTQCAGIHRKMGVHVSKVKSLTLDNWTKEQVDRMKEMGNLRSNQLHNPDEMRNRPPTNMEDSERDSELEKYIRQKYETRRFMAGQAPPVPSKDATFLRPESDVSPPRRSDDLLRNGSSIARSRTAPIPTTWSEAQARTKSRAPPLPAASTRQTSASAVLPSSVVPQRSSSAQVSAVTSKASTSKPPTTVFDDLIALDAPSHPTNAQPPLQMNPWASLQAQQPAVSSAPAVPQPTGSYTTSTSPASTLNTFSTMQQRTHSEFSPARSMQQYQQMGLLSPSSGSMLSPYGQQQHPSVNLGTMAFSTSPLPSPGGNNPFLSTGSPLPASQYQSASPNAATYAPHYQGQMQAGYGNVAQSMFSSSPHGGQMFQQAQPAFYYHQQSQAQPYNPFY